MILCLSVSGICVKSINISFRLKFRSISSLQNSLGSWFNQLIIFASVIGFCLPPSTNTSSLVRMFGMPSPLSPRIINCFNCSAGNGSLSIFFRIGEYCSTLGNFCNCAKSLSEERIITFCEAAYLVANTAITSSASAVSTSNTLYGEWFFNSSRILFNTSKIELQS